MHSGFESSSATESETDRVYGLLRSQILSGEIRPGARLLQASLAQWTNASRTPVREAVARLAAEGLVRITPRHGATVLQLSVRDIAELQQLREIVECAAVKLAARRISAEDLEELHSVLSDSEVDDPTRTQLADHLLHSVIAQHCGNDRLRQLLEDLYAKSSTLRFYDLGRRQSANLNTLQEIAAALTAHDGEGAERSMQAHINASWPVSVGLLDFEG